MTNVQYNLSFKCILSNISALKKCIQFCPTLKDREKQNNKVWIYLIFYCLNLDFYLPWLFKEYLKVCQQNLWEVEFKFQGNWYLILFYSWLLKHEKTHKKIPIFFLNYHLFFLLKSECLWKFSVNEVLNKWTVIFIPMTKMRNHNRYMITHLIQINAQRGMCKANMCTAYYVFSWDIFNSDKNRLDITTKMALTFF